MIVNFVSASCATSPLWQIKAVAEDESKDGQPSQWHKNSYRDRPCTRSALLDAYQKVMESRNYRGAAGSLRLASGTAEGHHC